MSDTYIGWDGNDYPWPPPEGWYEASDGRWWAPGTGPGPTPLTSADVDAPRPPERPAGGTVSASGAGGAGSVSFGPSNASGGDEPTLHLQRPTGRDDPSAQDQLDLTPTPAATPTSMPDFGATATFPLGDVAPAGPGAAPPPDTSAFPAPGGGFVQGDPTAGGAGNRNPLVIALGVVGALVVLGALYVFVLSGDGDDTADGGTVGATTTVNAADGAATDDGTATDGGPDGEADGSDDETDTSGDGTASEATDGTEDDTGDDSEAPTDAAAIEEFRQLLRDNGLTSDRLDDEQVVGFGSSFCALAESSSSLETFGEFRQQAIEDTANATLDTEELGLVIDSTVVAFCPDEAERLGIGG